LEVGEFTQVYMAPKFLQHLEEAMPPSTAELQEEEFQQRQQLYHQEPNFLASTASSDFQDEIYIEDGEKYEVKLNNRNSGSNTSHNSRKKKTDEVNQLSSGSTKNHPRGDGDSCP